MVNSKSSRPTFTVLSLVLLSFVALIGIVLASLEWSSMQGGQTVTSPHGRYRVDVAASLNPRPGEHYNILLKDLTSGETLIQLTAAFPQNRQPLPIRGMKNLVVWEPDESSVLIHISGSPEIRLNTSARSQTRFATAPDHTP